MAQASPLVATSPDVDVAGLLHDEGRLAPVAQPIVDLVRARVVGYEALVRSLVEIVVPPHLSVECEGRALLGSFSEVNRVPAEGAADGPVLRVIGSAVFGNVEIQTRPNR